MMEIDIQLGYQNNLWHCHNDQINIYSDDLSEMDAKIKDYLKKKYKQGLFKVKFYFDFDNFPLWMRQYMPHYFNRETVYELKVES